MEIVEVFKTNVQENEQASRVINTLLSSFPHCRINFDLQDCDKILRVQGREVRPEIIIKMVKSHGYNCEPLI